MKEIRRISITDAAVESIKELIESGEYKIDEKLPTEAALCNTLKVSRTCVREAMRVLQTLGYVKIVPGKGAFVANYVYTTVGETWYNVTDPNFYDFMEVRMAIETVAVKSSVVRATEKNISELESIHQSFCEANEEKDVVRMFMIDELFHTKIVSFTKNQLLININKELVNSFRKYRKESFTNAKVRNNAIEPHRKIIECFKKRDVDGAVAEMRMHLEITTHDMGVICGRETE